MKVFGRSIQTSSRFANKRGICKFRLITKQGCLAKHPHRTGIHLLNSHSVPKAILWTPVTCLNAQTTLTEKYWEARDDDELPLFTYFVTFVSLCYIMDSRQLLESPDHKKREILGS